MSSNRRISASRANGAKSTGPKTPESLARSSRSNRKHGLLARTIVLDDEDIQAFTDLLAGLEREFRPQGTVELALVETMAAGRWRVLRILSIERATCNSRWISTTLLSSLPPSAPLSPSAVLPMTPAASTS